MKRLLLLCLIGALSAGASLPGRSFPVSYAGARSPYEAGVDLARPERERIRAHLARVEASLRANPPEGLSEERRAARAARLDDLHAYWTRGEFPLNRDHAGRLIPYFIDADGVPCAMGYLVIASGHAGFAEDVRKNRNNAYIPEIAAADGRLAAWLEANGMTQEEAARVQPAYGPPRLNGAWRVHVDSLGRLWAAGPDANAVFNWALLRRDTATWKDQRSSGGYAEHCITRAGLVAEVNSSGPAVRWKGKAYYVPPLEVSNRLSCAWEPSEQSLWVGSFQGLWRFTRAGTADTLAALHFPTRLASDTVFAVAVTDSFVWAGTARGIVRRGLRGDTTPVAWDSAALGGKRVSTLRRGGGRTVWAGLEAGSASSRFEVFSTQGLLRYNGTTWQRYRAGMSSVLLPGDTIQALGTRDSGSAWIATKSGFHVFSGGPSTPKVADLPSGAAVYDIVSDGAGGFYAGTSLGVYRYSNNALTFLGQPAVGLRPGFAGKAPAPARGLKVMTRAEVARAGRLRSVSGREVPAGAAQGVYLPDAPR